MIDSDFANLEAFMALKVVLNRDDACLSECQHRQECVRTPRSALCAFLLVGLLRLEMPSCFTWNVVGEAAQLRSDRAGGRALAHWCVGAFWSPWGAIRCGRVVPALAASMRRCLLRGAQIGTARDHSHSLSIPTGRRVHIRTDSAPVSTARGPLFLLKHQRRGLRRRWWA